MSFNINPKELVGPIKVSLETLNKRIDDFKQVIPEAKALQVECEIFSKIIVGVLDKPTMPFEAILKDVENVTQTTSKILEKFKKHEEKDRCLVCKTGWLFKRVYMARKYRKQITAMTRKLITSKAKIQETLSFWSTVNKSAMAWFASELNKEAYGFWLEVCSAGPSAAKWVMFIEAYRHHYPKFEWTHDIEHRIRLVARSHGELLTIRGFITLYKEFGFPFNQNKILKAEINEDADLTTLLPTETTSSLNELIVEYSSSEFRALIQPIFTWYKGYRPGEPDWIQRAHEWAVEMIKYRGNDDLDELGKLVMAVDNARHTYMAFFQRCMVTMTSGHHSREKFAQVDFPGIGGISDFITHVRPLDHAHYHIYMAADPLAWQVPKVYTFFNEILTDEKKPVKKVHIAPINKVKHEQPVHDLKVDTNQPKMLDDIKLAESPSNITTNTNSTLVV